MSTAVAPMPSVMFGSPRDWDKWFWDLYHGAWLEILRAACPMDGQERYIEREIERRKLR